jgi:hypothetical protein
MRRFMTILIILFAATILSSAAATFHPSRPLFSGTLNARATKGKTYPFRVTIRKWDLDGSEDEVQVMSIRTFTVMSDCSGRIETTIDGKKEIRAPEEYWTVKAGSSVAVRVLSESAVLQTLAVTP